MRLLRDVLAGMTSLLPVNWECLSGPQCSVYVGPTSQKPFQKDIKSNVFESVCGSVLRIEFTVGLMALGKLFTTLPLVFLWLGGKQRHNIALVQIPLGN